MSKHYLLCLFNERKRIVKLYVLYKHKSIQLVIFSYDCALCGSSSSGLLGQTKCFCSVNRDLHLLYTRSICRSYLQFYTCRYISYYFLFNPVFYIISETFPLNWFSFTRFFKFFLNLSSTLDLLHCMRNWKVLNKNGLKCSNAWLHYCFKVTSFPGI